MKKILGILATVLMLIPAALAVDIGTGVSIDIMTEDFEPLIWMCDDRVVIDDRVETGRTEGNTIYDKDDNEKGNELIERHNNYAFTGEKLEYVVLVMDKNGINKIEDVFMTIGPLQGVGNDIEANCVELLGYNENKVASSCNARILEEKVEWDNQLMRYYECTFTVEPDMYEEYFITAEVCDLDGLCSIVDENEYWFLNPVIALAIDGDISFGTVRPGTTAYSDTILVGNDADLGSGVTLDMFISGTDFYDSNPSGAQCPTTNQLALHGEGPNSAFTTSGEGSGPKVSDDTGIRYFVTNGAYNSAQDQTKDDSDLLRDRFVDQEGYLNIQYADSFSTLLYDEAEILQANAMGVYWGANFLTPGAEMALTFKLVLPEPCNGDFDSGSIFFWGEAV